MTILRSLGAVLRAASRHGNHGGRVPVLRTQCMIPAVTFSSQSTSDVLVRDARPEDYDEVIAIHGNVHFGFDYLSTFYHQFLRDPASVCRVAIIDDKIVGYWNGMSIFEGEAFLSMAGRVHVDFQNMGVMTALKQHNARQILNRFPNTKEMLWVAYLTPRNLEKVDKDQDFVKKQLLRRWNVVGYPSTLDKMKSLINDEPLTSAMAQELEQTRCLRPEEALAALLQPEVVPRLFNGSSSSSSPLIGCVYWRPARPVTNDLLPLIQSGNVVGTFDDSGSLRAVSFGHGVELPTANKTNMHYFCGEESGSRTLLAHCVLQMRHMCDSRPNCDDVGLFVNFSQHVDDEEVREFFEPRLAACSVLGHKGGMLGTVPFGTG